MKIGSRVLILAGLVSSVNAQTNIRGLKAKASTKPAKELAAPKAGKNAAAKAGKLAKGDAAAKSLKAFKSKADGTTKAAKNSKGLTPAPTVAPSNKPSTSEPTTSLPTFSPTVSPVAQVAPTPAPTFGMTTLKPITPFPTITGKDSLEPTDGSGGPSPPPITPFPTTGKDTLKPTDGVTPFPTVTGDTLTPTVGSGSPSPAPTSYPPITPFPTISGKDSLEPTDDSGGPSPAPTSRSPTDVTPFPTSPPYYEPDHPTSWNGSKASKDERRTEATDRKLFGKSSKSKGAKQAVNKGASETPVDEVAAIIETVQTLTQAILTDTNTAATTRPGKTDKEETNEDYDVDLIETLPKLFGQAKAAKRAKQMSKASSKGSK